MENFSSTVPLLLASLQENNFDVARQSIIRGSNMFCHAMNEIQIGQHAKVDKKFDELWQSAIKFKDAIFSVVLEPGPVAKRLLGMKFLETYMLFLSSDVNDSQRSITEVLDLTTMKSEANKILEFLLTLLQSAKNIPGALTIALVNCLEAIAKKRTLHYRTILSALLAFDPPAEMGKGGHAASIKYSLRTVFLGFLRSTCPSIVESRDELLRALRSLNAGDAAEQVIRQVDKIAKNNDRASRDSRLSKIPPGDSFKKRPLFRDNDSETKSRNIVSKRMRNGCNGNMTFRDQSRELRPDLPSKGKILTNASFLSTDLAPAEQMIAMIGALLGEGERGAESLDILIMNMHPDVLADIVITNMKHLPKATLFENSSYTHQVDISRDTQKEVSVKTSTVLAQAVTDVPCDDTAASIADSKRDPRKDMRRLDPRRFVVPVNDLSSATLKDTSQSVDEGSHKLPSFGMPITNADSVAIPVTPNVKSISGTSEAPCMSGSGSPTLVPDIDIGVKPKSDPSIPDNVFKHHPEVKEDAVAQQLSITTETDLVSGPSLAQIEQHDVAASCQYAADETSEEFPPLPLFVEQTKEQQLIIGKSSVERIIDACINLPQSCYNKMCMKLLPRLVAQMDSDQDVLLTLQKHVLSNYDRFKAYELVLNILYHLHSLILTVSVVHSTCSVLYEKFFLAAAEWLLHNLPASDKSFSKLLGEAPVLPDSVLKVLEDLCFDDMYDSHGNEIRDADRVTQGLGAVWSLILGRPPYRQACLDIALKCAVHIQDDIRSKAIRLVANKLYVLGYAKDNICQFATNTLLSAVDHQDLQVESTEERSGEVSTQEASISGSQLSSLENSEHHSSRGGASVNISSLSVRHSQRLVSLYFALCMKEGNLLRIVFDVYARASKAVKQIFSRHIPSVVRSLGSSCSELLSLIADPPEGSEPLVLQVLQILTEGATPSSDLIAIVKHLYHTKLKDAGIIIPILSSITKTEVLPIFPQLVNLPLEIFQLALAHVLQGSAHTGPALTPVEVLVAIHDINPEKDGIPLKKITDACSTCFEQRVVFTQQVVKNALSEMVEQPSLPLLFMRTVIQAIDAFPSLVDFIMEILSKLVNRQVWRMPKLWVGFLKCVSQTQPHSFHVLLQLPFPQLESALNKYSNLKTPLVAYARHPGIRAALSKPILSVLGILNESQSLERRIPASLQPSDAASSVHGATTAS